MEIVEQNILDALHRVPIDRWGQVLDYLGTLAGPPGKNRTVESEAGQAEARERGDIAPGDGIRRSAGGWAEDTEELDTYLAWVRQQRKLSRPELEP